jgi:DNA repair photolyase
LTFKGWGKEKIVLADGSSTEAICPVIISASRATDIPAFFAPWFINRINAGYLRWTNPFNTNNVQHISFKRTRLIVFWSKNPKPLLRYLPELDAKGINYYIQFTINDYQLEGLEPNVPPLQQRIETFQYLSELIGKKRVIWRYDPLVLTNTLNVEHLVDRIANVAKFLKAYTERLVISFADIGLYKKVQYNLIQSRIAYKEFTPALTFILAEYLQKLNQEWKLKISTCAEGIDLSNYGIEHNKCIDDNLTVELFNNDLKLMDFMGYQPNLFSVPSWPYIKDKGQRKECGCIVSKDIGMYNTCHHLCTYCYANSSTKAVEINFSKHNPTCETLIE